MKTLQEGEYLILRGREVYLIKPCPGCNRQVCKGQTIASVNHFSEKPWLHNRSDPKAKYEFRYTIAKKSDAIMHPNIDYRQYCHDAKEPW